MSNIQPSLPPIVNTPSAPASGAAAKGEAGAASDFLSLVVDAAAEDAPPKDGEGIAGPLVESADKPLTESAEAAIAVAALPTVMPDAALIDLAAQVPTAPAPVVEETTTAADALGDALANAGKAKAVSDVLLAAQAPVLDVEAVAAETPIDADAPLPAAVKPEEAKAAKEQTAALPGSLLSMTETPETGAEVLPAALAFRKALDSRANAERTSEPATDTARSEGTAAARNDARPLTDPAVIARANADTTTPATAATDDEALSALLDHGAKHAHGDNPVDALLGGKTGDAKHANFASALTMVKGVAVNPQAVVAQVAVQLTAAGKAKTQAMTVKLEPVELGKIDIRLDFGADGKVQASIIADRPQTLDMLQKDARGLEKALQSAGLQTDSGSLSFNLRGQDRDQAQNDGGQKFAAGDDSDAVFGGETLSVIAGQARSAAAGRVDLLL